MPDWKRKVDALLETENLDYEQKQKTAEHQKNAESKAKAQDYSNKMRKHSEGFKCHICHQSSSGPVIIAEHWKGGSLVDPSDGTFVPEEVLWERPLDLWRCSRCNLYTCSDHLYCNICMECAEKL